ncbi:hypothetical protein IFM51744_10970 [Aspergillus udagawae]|nr:hypothetical protein IFM51744_10970 [Aspergillus udagawae]
MPTFEERTTIISAKYVNGEDIMARIVVEPKRIDDRDTRVSNCDSNTTAETKHCGLSSVSLSDQSTIVEERDAKALEATELSAVSSSYVENSTGKRMIKLYYELSLSLDDLKIREVLNLVSQSLRMI